MKTIKKWSLLKLTLCTIIISGFQFASLAQEQELRISPLRFAGVHALGNTHQGNGGYMVVHTASGSNWNYNLFDGNLRLIKENQIETPKFAFFNGLVSNGDYTMLNFLVNAFNQSITYVVLNKQGIETGRVTRENATMLRRGDQFFPNIYSHPHEGFIVTETRGKGKNTGYVVEHLSNNLQTLWSREIPSQKGNNHVFDLVVSENRVFILEATERMGRTRNTRLHSLSAEDGSHLFTIELNDAQNSFFPTALKPLENGGIALMGTYFKGDRINTKKTQGLFFLIASAEGQTITTTKYPWRELRPLLRTRVPDWFFKLMPDVWVHALEVSNDGTFTAVAELYRYSGEVTQMEGEKVKEKYHRIRMLDFMLFSFSENGEMTSADRIERPHMVLKFDSEISSGSSSLSHAAGQGPLKRGRAMKKAGAFTYRFHNVYDDGFINLAFMSYENKMHYAYLMDLGCDYNSVKVDLAHAKPKILSYLQIVDLCANQSGFGFIMSELNTRSFDDSEAYWRGILPAEENSMLLYEYMPLNGKLKMRLVKMSEK